PLKNNLGLAPKLPPNKNPPILSFIIGCENEPPPALANCSDKMFGKEFCWPAINKAPSINPAEKDAPTATYFEKSAFPAVKGGNGSFPIPLLSSSLHAVNPIKIDESRIYFIVFICIFFIVYNCQMECPL